MREEKFIVFDDAAATLGPMGDLRAAFAQRTGVRTTLERIEHALGHRAAALWVPDRLAALTRQGLTDRSACAAPVNAMPTGLRADDDVLLINGRRLSLRESSAHLPQRNEAVTTPDGTVTMIRLPVRDAQAWLERGGWALPEACRSVGLDEAAHLQHPWDILTHLPDLLPHDILASGLPALDHDALPPGVTVVGDHPVLVHPDAVLLPQLVLDASDGPILVDAHAKLCAFAVLKGPCAALEHSVVNPLACVRANVVVGPHCKVAGELSNCILHSYTNKAHHGYLGGALVGSWCNLGAGTTVSNLKNTYGNVRAQLTPDADPIDTGHQFLGPLLGDFVRTAICTKLNTGSVVGAGCMLATSAFPPKCLGPKRFLTDDADAPYDNARLLDTVRHMMARRDLEPSAALTAWVDTV